MMRIFFLLLVSVSAYAQLTKDELKLLKNVEKSYDESVSFLEKTVNINSGTYNDGYPSMPPTDGNVEVLKRFSKTNVDLGLGEVEPYDPGKRGAGDISFVAQYLDCLDGLGAMGGNAHAPGEFINLNSLQNIEKRVALLCYRITNEKVATQQKK